MDKTERDQLEELIIMRIEKIKAQVEELKEESKAVEPDCAIGRVSRMDAINNKSISEAALQKKELQLRGLYAALENIDQPDFGKCLICGAEMQKERIILMPENRKCIKCARR